MKPVHVLMVVSFVAAVGCSSNDTSTTEQAASAPVAGDAFSGAIFTTYATGSVVNANIYDDCRKVYLNGGPAGGVGLPPGDYYFQVTSPSSGPPSALLSNDDIALRRVHVGSSGKITAYMAPFGATALHGTMTQPDGSVRVQLWPFDATPNPGNEYKAWLTPVTAYDPGQGTFGFLPRWSKTDNFKCVWTPAPPIDELPDGGAFDVGPPDTCPVDTGPADTGPADTGPVDTGPIDQLPDTGPFDAGVDTGPEDTGPQDTRPEIFIF